jgi:hypothetical protein
MKPIKVNSIDVPHINSHKSETTIDELRPLVTEFVSKLELKGEFDTELLAKIQSLDINQDVFTKMLNDLDSFLEFHDVDSDEVDFPYEEWLPQMILIDDNYKA